VGKRGVRFWEQNGSEQCAGFCGERGAQPAHDRRGDREPEHGLQACGLTSAVSSFAAMFSLRRISWGATG